MRPEVGPAAASTIPPSGLLTPRAWEFQAEGAMAQRGFASAREELAEPASSNEIATRRVNRSSALGAVH